MEAVFTLLLAVSSGDYDRLDTPVFFPCRLADLGLTPQEAPKARFLLREQGTDAAIPAQWDNGGDPAAAEGRLAWTLPGKTPRGATRTFSLVVEKDKAPTPVMTAEVKDATYIQIANATQPVIRFNHGLQTQFPDKPSKFDRACYFHPVWVPSGDVITGDWNPNHAHHRGIWFAWVKAKAGDIDANFWEIQEGRGKTVNKALAPVGGPVFAGFDARDECVSGGKAILNEWLGCRAYAGGGPWLVDLTVRHEATDADVELGKMHYGGLGFRGRDEWDGKGGQVDALTSEGKTRPNANATRARWLDYTGALPEGRWAGILILDAPSNPRYPNGVRVHPTMCFASTTLVQPEAYTIRKGEPLVLRYRLALHGGKPDKALAERLAADFAHPPEVKAGK